jgi:hypothetical protein
VGERAHRSTPDASLDRRHAKSINYVVPEPRLATARVVVERCSLSIWSTLASAPYSEMSKVVWEVNKEEGWGLLAPSSYKPTTPASGIPFSHSGARIPTLLISPPLNFSLYDFVLPVPITIWGKGKWIKQGGNIVWLCVGCLLMKVR